jgi:hypothetical protein
MTAPNVPDAPATLELGRALDAYVGLAGLKGRHGELDTMSIQALQEYGREARAGAHYASASVQQARSYGDWERVTSREELVNRLNHEADAAAAWLRERGAPEPDAVQDYPDGRGGQFSMPPSQSPMPPPPGAPPSGTPSPSPATPTPSPASTPQPEPDWKNAESSIADLFDVDIKDT